MYTGRNHSAVIQIDAAGCGILLLIKRICCRQCFSVLRNIVLREHRQEVPQTSMQKKDFYMKCFAWQGTGFFC